MTLTLCLSLRRLIRSRDAVEEFLACGFWPLSEKFGFKMETKETPLSKVVVLMPQVTAIIGAQESGAEFEARITNAMNLLVGNYNITEHNACQELRHGWVNHIFELVRVLCQPHPEPAVQKRMSMPVLMPKKASEKQKCRVGSSRSRTQTFTQELSMAKPMKMRKKFVVQSLGLSIAEKTSPMGVKVARKRASSTFACGSDVAPVSARALDLFDSGSSSLNGEAAPQALPQKCSRKSHVPKNVSKSSTAKGSLEYFLSLLLL
jgi:hypothetical protein